MNRNSFLKGFIIYSGIVEIFFAIVFCFSNYICEFFNVECLPFFYLFTAVELGLLGFLLLYSARDINRYLIIIICSCIFRYIMLGPSIYTAITVPGFRYILIGAMLYDALSATFTLILLQQCQFFKKSEKIAKS